MNSLQKTSSYVLKLVDFLLVTLPLLLVTGWIFIDSPSWRPVINRILCSPIQTPEGDVYFTQVAWTFASKCVGFLATALSLAPILAGLWLLKKILSRYTAGNIFSRESAQNYNYLGWLFFLDALLLKPITDCLYVFMATLSNEPGHRYLVLMFGSTNIKALFYGTLVIIISWVILEGTKLKEDQNLTI